MRCKQTILASAAGAAERLTALIDIEPNLVLVFSAPSYFEDSAFIATLRNVFGQSVLMGCSTAGEISSQGVSEQSCVVTAIHFSKVATHCASTDLQDMADSHAAGRRLGGQLLAAAPRAVLVFGQGVNINGSALIEGMTEDLGDAVVLTGGLAGDYGKFARTWVLGPDGVSDRSIVALGLSGDALNFAHGSFGGWEAFGPVRQVTRCTGNILYELDGEPALNIYKRYLGDYAKDLPGSGLLFPFAMLGEDQSELGLIRTILGINETDGSLVLAGEIHSKGYLRLMHGSTDRLVDGAETAADAVRLMQQCRPGAESFGLLVSCVGRKLVMGDRTDEEVEAVSSILGGTVPLLGFYSNGEISPLAPGVSCKLHNQTMTVTCIGEH